MKYLIALTFFGICFTTTAQKPCDYSMNVNDSLGTYKSTTEYIISEQNFAGTSDYVFFSLALTDGVPTLNVQLLQKSKSFLKANCFDENSKIYLQLNNGKIITLLHIKGEDCGSLLRDDKNYDNRVIAGSFLFMKDSFEELKKSPLSLMRIKFLTDTQDYVIKKEFTSELNAVVYQPEKFFINTIPCIE